MVYVSKYRAFLSRNLRFCMETRLRSTSVLKLAINERMRLNRDGDFANKYVCVRLDTMIMINIT